MVKQFPPYDRPARPKIAELSCTAHGIAHAECNIRLALPKQLGRTADAELENRRRQSHARSWRWNCRIPYNPQYAFLKEATPEALSEMTWLYPHFVTPDGALTLSIHALAVEAPGLKLVVDTCIGNDRARGILGGEKLQTAFLDHMKEIGFGRDAGERRRLHASPCRSRRLEHDAGRRQMGADISQGALFHRPRGIRALEIRRRRRAEGDPRRFRAADLRCGTGAGSGDDASHIAGDPSDADDGTHAGPCQRRDRIQRRDRGHHRRHDASPCQIGHPDWTPPFDTDKDASRATRKAMLKDWADKPILIIGTHFATPTAGHIKKDGASYRFEV